MGEAKNRKEEIKNLKAGKMFVINEMYDDFDNAGLIILKTAKVKHEDLGNDCYSYRTSSTRNHCSLMVISS